jgi:hypothetical protein
MNRSTIAATAVFASLLLIWLVTGREADTTEIPPFVIDGYLDDDISLQDIKVLNKDEASPYSHFEIIRLGERSTLDMVAGEAEKKPSERKWHATRTKGDKTWEATGESYRVKMLNQLLARPFRSSYAFKASPDELVDYQLDPEHAVDLIATAPDRKVHIRVGKASKSEEGGGETWVQNPAEPSIIYQIAGHDLRTELDVGWKDIRERKIVGLHAPSIDRIELDNPRAPNGLGHVVATRPPLSDAQRKLVADGAKPDDVRKSEDGWQIIEPAGFAAGEIGGWLDSVERMTMTETYDTTGGKMPADAGLDDEAGTVHLRLSGQNSSFHITLGTKAPKGDQGDIYVALEGTSIVYSVASWSADQVIKDLDSLRDVRLLGERKAEACNGITIKGEGAAFVATRQGDSWSASGIDLDPSNLDDYLRDLVGTRVEFKSRMTADSAGLSTPLVQIALSFGDEIVELEVGKVGDTTYGRHKGVDIFTLQSWSADRLTRTGRDFVNKHLLRRDKNLVVAIDMPNNNSFKELTRSGGNWVVTGEPTASVDASKIDALLDSLSTYEYHAEYDVDAKSVGLNPPAWNMRMRFGDGSSWALALSETKRDNNPYATLQSGKEKPKLVTISAMMIEAIRKSWTDVAGANRP